jgi:hypothetical protein
MALNSYSNNHFLLTETPLSDHPKIDWFSIELFFVISLKQEVRHNDSSGLQLWYFGFTFRRLNDPQQIAYLKWADSSNRKHKFVGFTFEWKRVYFWLWVTFKATYSESKRDDG